MRTFFIGLKSCPFVRPLLVEYSDSAFFTYSLKTKKIKGKRTEPRDRGTISLVKKATNQPGHKKPAIHKP